MSGPHVRRRRAGAMANWFYSANGVQQGPVSREAPPPLPTMATPIAYASAGPSQPALGEDATMRWLLPVGRSGWAIAAGYLGLLSVLMFPAPFGLICGILAIRDIRKDPRKHGM